MRNLISCVLSVIVMCSLVMSDASAGRFGGGRSFGVQRSHSSLFSPHTQQSSKFSNQSVNKGKWGSALGGLLAGGLLASLFMGHGFGAGLLSWLVIGVLVFLVVGIFRRKMQPAFQSAQAHSFKQNSSNHFSDYRATEGSNIGSSAPIGFDAEGFLRSAKVTFIRLQAAYDQKNLQDLHEFTAPDVFGEIKMQLDERADAPNITEVVSVDAALLNVAKQANGTIASVRFTGFIKENDAPMSALDEIWHFRQFASNAPWVVAGIQQQVH